MLWVGFLLFVNSFFEKIPFFKKMTHNKKNAHNNERNSDGQDDTETHPNRVVHFIIMKKNKRAQSKTNNSKDYAANIFPFPCNDKKGE